MNLYIQQKVFSFGDKFSVCDQSGNPVYYVEGEVFSFGKKLHIYDLNRNEVCKIEQELFQLMPAFTIRIPGRREVRMVRKFTLFVQEYRIDEKGWEIEGDFFNHEYSIKGARGEVARMSKEWLSWGDAYELTVHDPQDAVLALAAVLTIDAVNDSN